MYRTTVIIVIAAIIASSASGADIRTVALTGDPVPGKPSGVIFWNFGGYLLSGSGPQLDVSGHTTFTAYLTGEDVAVDSGIWSDASGSLALTAASGAHPPDVPEGISYWAVTDYVFTSYVLTSQGQMGMIATITGAGVTSANNYGIWWGSPDEFRLIVREGDHAPGTPNGIKFNQEGTANTPQILGSGSRLAFSASLAGTGVDWTNDAGIWVTDFHSIELLVREGDQAAGAPSDVVFSSVFQPWCLNPAGEVAFLARLRGNGVSPVNDFGLWAGAPGSLRLIARSGEPAPGLPNGVRLSSFGVRGIDAAGRVAFQAQVAGDAVDNTNDDGIWIEENGSLTLVAREGDRAPGTPDGVVFGGYSRGSSVGRNLVLLNSARQIAFFGILTGDSVTDANRAGIWRGSPGTVELVARTGDNAPGTGNGVTFRYLSESISINSLGQVAFTAGLVGDGVDGTNDYGIWAHDPAGALQLVVRKGDLLKAAPGDFRTISYLGFFGGSGNSDGRPSGFNDRGQLAFRAAFTDGTEGIFVSNRVAVPEPSSMGILFVALMCISLPPRSTP